MSSPLYQSCKKDDCLTPRHIVEAARVATGGKIDLDPCSNSGVRPNVPVTRHFTRDDDGLKQGWSGGVFQNHPYSHANVRVKKALSEVASGRVDQVTILDAARPDTKRFQQFSGYPVAFVRGRIRFIDGMTGTPGPAPTIPSALFYVKSTVTDSDYRCFHAAFSKFSAVFRGADL